MVGVFLMCKCRWCGKTFDKPLYRQEVDGFDENNREIVMQTFKCPYCGDTDLEWLGDFDDGYEEFFVKMEEERREREELLNEW